MRTPYGKINLDEISKNPVEIFKNLVENNKNTDESLL